MKNDEFPSLKAPNGITRRTFGAGVLSTGLYLAGGAVPARAKDASSDDGVGGGKPKRGGTVRFAYTHGDATEALDPALFDDTVEYVRGMSMFDYLTSVDGNGAPVPEAAESWEPNTDATSWVFKLRKGMVFSDGSPLRPEDVIYSIMRHTDKSVTSTAKALVGGLKSGKKTGENEVTFELDKPDVDFPITAGLFQFALLKEGTKDFSEPLKIVGSGPFLLTDFQAGIRSIFERNPRYRKEGQPYIDKLITFPIPDDDARVNALLAGDVELIANVSGNGIDQVKNSSNTKLFVTPAPRYTALQAIVDRQPSSNHDLTIALAYLTDRKRILNTVLRGYGEIANDHPFSPSSPYYNGDLPQRELDREKAKHFFQKSGIGQARFELSAGLAAQYSLDIAQMIVREATGIGMNVGVRNEPSDGYWTAVAGKKPYCFTNFQSRPTYNQLLNLAWRTGAVWNFSHYSNPKLDELIDLTRSTLDVKKRTGYYHDVQEIIYNSGAIVLPTFLNYVDAHSNKVNGLTPVPIGYLGGFNFPARIWLED